jgi:hypothetical protein
MRLKLSNKDIILVKNKTRNSNTGRSSVWRNIFDNVEMWYLVVLKIEYLMVKGF